MSDITPLYTADGNVAGYVYEGRMYGTEAEAVSVRDSGKYEDLLDTYLASVPVDPEQGERARKMFESTVKRVGPGLVIWLEGFESIEDAGNQAKEYMKQVREAAKEAKKAERAAAKAAKEQAEAPSEEAQSEAPPAPPEM